MVKAKSRFATAKDRLRRIEDAIRPYTDRQFPNERPPKGEWIPSGFWNELDRNKQKIAPKETNDA